MDTDSNGRATVRPVLMVSLLLSFVHSPGVLDAQTTVEVPQLYGIASLQVKKESIEVTKDQALPAGMDLRGNGGERVEKATIKVGESFAVTDGHHIGHKYMLIAIEDNVAKLQTTFWTSFLGREPTESKSMERVGSYVTRRKKQ